MDRLNYFSLLTPAGGMRPKRRAVTQTCVMLEPWVAVAPTCKTKCNQFARVNLPTSSETVARSLASAIKTGISAKGYACRIPSIFQTNKGAKAMINYINTHAWTWYAFAAIWAVVIGSAV